AAGKSRFRTSRRGRLRRRLELGVEVGNDVLEGGNGLLNRRDLHHIPAPNWAVAVLQRDDQIPPLLLELDKRQTVVGQMSHHGVPTPCIERAGAIAGRL